MFCCDLAIVSLLMQDISENNCRNRLQSYAEQHTLDKYTANELAMLRAFYNESIASCGYCTEGENMSYMNANDLQAELGGTKQSIGGTMASLLEKGAIADMGESARGAKVNDFVLADMEIAAEFGAEEIA